MCLLVQVAQTPNNADGNKDTIGADGSIVASPTPVTGVVAGAGVPVAGNLGGAGITGTFGTLVMNANGSYTYTPNYSNPTVLALSPGATLTDAFTYGIADSDGDATTTTLTITIVGVPAVVGLGDGTVAGTDGSVLESDLAAGTNAAGNGDILNGSFQIVSPVFPVIELTVGSTVIPIALLLTSGTTPITINVGLGAGAGSGTLIINGYDALTGLVSYKYTLNSPNNSGITVTENFAVSIKDGAGNITPPKDLSIAIIDDAPIANNDVDSITENITSPATGNVITGIDTASPDGNITDGVADNLGADGAAITGAVSAISAGTGAPVGSVNTAIVGSYGTLTMQANGNYSYVLNNANATVNALKVGQSLTEIYTYLVTDKDGDTATARLSITINVTFIFDFIIIIILQNKMIKKQLANTWNRLGKTYC